MPFPTPIFTCSATRAPTLTLITGGSGIALGLPKNFARELADVERRRATCRRSKVRRSCWRAAPRRRPMRRSRNGAPAGRRFRIDPMALSRGEPVVEQAIAFAKRACRPARADLRHLLARRSQGGAEGTGRREGGASGRRGAGIDRTRIARSRRAQVRRRGRRDVRRRRAGARRASRCASDRRSIRACPRRNPSAQAATKRRSRLR